VGVFIVTIAAYFALRAMAHLLRPLRNQIGQFEQASGVQRRAPRSQFHERISLNEICPYRWNLAQMAAVIVEIQVTFGEDKTVL
jgi:hypothetical protein